MNVIADTVALYPCYDRSDAHHRRVRDFLSTFTEILWVPALVLAELDHLISVRLGEAARSTVIRDVLDVANVLSFSHHIADRAATVAQQYAAFPLGLTDASLVVHAEDFNSVNLFTTDQRHFRAVRPLNHSNSFRLLPFDL